MKGTHYVAKSDATTVSLYISSAYVRPILDKIGHFEV